MRRFVIFDLDGVLVESEPYWRDGFRAGVAHLARHLDQPAPVLTDDRLRQYEGGRVPDTLTRLGAALFDVDPAVLARLIPSATDIAIDTARTLLRADPSPIEASVQTAKELAAAGYVLAVASSSARPFIDAALDAVGLTGSVAAVESAFDLEHPKPHPQVYRNALAAVGATTATAVAVEDSRTGVEAAFRAGLRTVWVTANPDASMVDVFADDWDPARVPVVDRLRLRDVERLFGV